MQDQNHVLTINDFQIIFNILKSGKKYEDKEHPFYEFFDKQFKEYYFNPKKTDNEYLISGKYMDQVMKNNWNVMFSAIINNIKYNFEKYLNRFIKCHINIAFKKERDYFDIIKKCSTYEMYFDDKNYDLIKGLVFCLTVEKDMYGSYNHNTLTTLASFLRKKKKGKIIRTIVNK